MEKEGVKKIGYLGRGIKGECGWGVPLCVCAAPAGVRTPLRMLCLHLAGAYLQKFGNVQLTEEEAKRRAEYMQPLLDGLKQAKEQYSTVKDAATAAIENA